MYEVESFNTTWLNYEAHLYFFGTGIASNNLILLIVALGQFSVHHIRSRPTTSSPSPVLPVVTQLPVSI